MADSVDFLVVDVGADDDEVVDADVEVDFDVVDEVVDAPAVVAVDDDDDVFEELAVVELPAIGT